MKRINDSKLLEKYIFKHSIDEIFTKDMRPFMELYLFERNEYICREGEDINYLYFFVEGRAKVYTTLENGKSLLLSFYQEFKLLGDLEVVNPQPTTTNVQVIKDAYCIGISSDNIKQHLLKDAKFLRFICNSLGEKLKRCSKNSSINLLYPLENRLASYMLATSEGIDGSSKNIVMFNESLTEISQLLGTSYRHLLRTLNNLCSKDIIKREKNYFEVVDDKTLKDMASDIYINNF